MVPELAVLKGHERVGHGLGGLARVDLEAEGVAVGAGLGAVRIEEGGGLALAEDVLEVGGVLEEVGGDDRHAGDEQDAHRDEGREHLAAQAFALLLGAFEVVLVQRAVPGAAAAAVPGAAGAGVGLVEVDAGGAHGRGADGGRPDRSGAHGRAARAPTDAEPTEARPEPPTEAEPVGRAEPTEAEPVGRAPPTDAEPRPTGAWPAGGVP
nr:hypothetical protein GCM10025732_07490 [Glycomyces mayteni]